MSRATAETNVRLVRILENGHIALPADMRHGLGLNAGDVVAVSEIANGILIFPREHAVINALDEIGDALREQGLSLDDMIERGRTIRGELFDEWYSEAESKTT